ncbi:hypothetical protein ACLB2K_011749 [Fragaria x ananassa]
MEDVCPPHPDERAALLRPPHQVQRPVHAGAQGRRGPGGREGKVVQVYRHKWVIHIERKTRFRRLVLFCDSAATRSLRRRNMAALGKSGDRNPEVGDRSPAAGDRSPRFRPSLFMLKR